MSPDATVIVPTRAGAARLPMLLASLAAQEGASFEVVAVVDGDVDGSGPMLDRAAAELPFPLRVIVFPENRGRVAALNAGAELARGRILIRSDDDLTFGPRHVAGHVARHAHGERGVIGLCRNVFGESDYAWAYGRRSDLDFRRAALEVPPEGQWRCWGANVSVPRATHERLGGYDPRYRAYGWEDIDFGYRLHEAGLPVLIARELEADHHGPGNLEQRALRAFNSGASRQIFLAAHGEDALGRQAPPAGSWGALVRTTSRLLDAGRIARIGSMLDRRAHLLPHAVAEKLMALLVEASSDAGRHRGHAPEVLL